MQPSRFDIVRALPMILFTVLLTFNTVRADEISIATAGKAHAVVVTSATPTAEETTSAEWLVEYLQRISGATLRVVSENAADLPVHQICVGDTRAARSAGIDIQKLKSEEWRIKMVGSVLVLAGGRPRGTIYAVTEFLETQLGVMMLDPFTEVVPARTDLKVGTIDRQGKPTFPMRSLFSGFPYRNPAGGGRLIERFRVWNRNTIDGRVAAGDHVRMIPSGVHTFGSFISSKEFAKSNPEYFGMDAAGKRITDDLGTPSAWTQLCMTNADVRRLVMERSRQFLKEERQAALKEQRTPAEWLVVSQNDNTLNLCLCPNCQAIVDREGTESGPLIDFVNHIAKEIQTEFPEVSVMTEAYNFTLRAPSKTTPDKNVVVRFCDNYGFSDLTHPLKHPRNKRSMSLFQGWQDKGCQLGVWDYWRVFRQFPPGLFAPSSNVRALHADVQMFRQAGVESMTVECEDLFGAGINDDSASADLQSFMPLRTWIGLKLMADPNRDLDELVTLFFQGFYGPAAEPMRKLWTLIEDRQQALATRVVDVQRHSWLLTFFDAPTLATAYRYLDEADRLACQSSGDGKLTMPIPRYTTHVRRERIVLDSAFLWLEEFFRNHTASATDLPKRRDVLARHRTDWNEFLSTVFDDEGQSLAHQVLDTGLDLVSRLRPQDTRGEQIAQAISEADVTLDGQLNEAFWKNSLVQSLLPRDPTKPNDNSSTIRFAWTNDALYVGIAQSADNPLASIGVSLQREGLKGVQTALYGPQREGTLPINGYFHDYDETGALRQIKDRKSASTWAGHVASGRVTTELRFVWADIATDPARSPPIDRAERFVLNIEGYPKPESNVPTFVSSPWLIGKSPTWHAGYYQALRLEKKAMQ